MRVPITTAGVAVALFVLGTGAVVWVGHAYDSVPIRWDPSIGNSCRAVDPATMVDLRQAAAVPLVLLALCGAGLSAVAGVVAQRDATSVAEARARQVGVAISAISGGGLLWLAYAVGDVFVVAFVVVLGALALLVVGGALGRARLSADSWEGLGRPFWLAVLQLLVVPGIVMAMTYTDEIPIC